MCFDHGLYHIGVTTLEVHLLLLIVKINNECIKGDEISRSSLVSGSDTTVCRFFNPLSGISSYKTSPFLGFCASMLVQVKTKIERRLHCIDTYDDL